MAKYGTGELVRFKESELLVSAGAGGTVKIGTDGLVGKITGSVETTGEETKYYVEVKLPDGTFAGVSDVVLKLTALESQIQSEKEYLGYKFDEFTKRVIPTFSPDPYGWLKGFMSPAPLRGIKPAKELTVGIRSSGKPIYSFLFSDFAFPMTKDKIEEYEKKFNEYARNIMKGVDSAVPGGDKNGVSVVDGKMSKDKCVKLLQSYCAEREKVKKGRKFERCLRDSVVDEALERAIELLKE